MNFLELIGAHNAVAVFLANEIAKIFGPEEAFHGHLGDIGVPVVNPMDFSAWI